MADVAKMIEEHLQRRSARANGEPNFTRFLNGADQYEAHGMGVVIEELMTPEERIKLYEVVLMRIGVA
jgi:hypothetical protein